VLFGSEATNFPLKTHPANPIAGRLRNIPQQQFPASIHDHSLDGGLLRESFGSGAGDRPAVRKKKMSVV